MNVSAKAEEILEALWITTEEKGEDAAHFERLDIAPDDEGLTELIGLAYVEVNGEWQIQPGQAHMSFHMACAASTGGIVKQGQAMTHFNNGWKSDALI